MLKNSFLDSNIIDHSHFLEADRKVGQFLTNGRMGDFLFLEGPSGSGKKALLAFKTLEYLHQHLTELQHSQVKPVVGFPVPEVEDKETFLRSFYKTWIGALIEQSSEDMMSLVENERDALDVSVGNDVRKRRVVTYLKQRQAKLVLMGKAYYLRQWDEIRPKNTSSIFESISSIAEEAECKVIFYGEFGIFDENKSSRAIIDKSKVVDLPAYRLEDPKEARAWRSLVFAMGKYLPGYMANTLNKNVNMVAYGSLGCIGRLIEWIDRAKAMKMAGKSSKEFTQYLKETMLSEHELALLCPGLHRAQLQPNLSEKEMRKRVGLVVNVKGTPKKGNNKPFARTPKRDYVPPL